MAEVKIVPNQTFLDGKNRYEEDEEYMVDETLAFYFGRNGWLKDVAGEEQPTEVDLEVDSSTLGHEGGEL